MPAVLAGTGLVWLGFSQGEEGGVGSSSEIVEISTGAAEPTKPFLPDEKTDTLSAEPTKIKRGVKSAPGQEPVLLAATDSADPVVSSGATQSGGYVETFPLAEARTGDRDARFNLSVANPPRAVTAEEDSTPGTALAAVTTGPSSAAEPARAETEAPDEIVRRIEKLRSTFRENLDEAVEEVTDVRKSESVAPRPADADEGEISESASSRPRPFAFSRPASTRPPIGRTPSSRTLARSGSGDSGAHAAAAPAGGEGEVIASIGPETPFSDIAAAAPPRNSPERKGLLARLFTKKPSREERAAAAAAAAAGKSTLEQFPKPDAPQTKASRIEDETQELIDQIYQEYVGRVERITASDLKKNSRDRTAVPDDFDTVWTDRVRRGFWVGEEPLAVRLEEIYARALINSNRVRVFGYDPLIRETAIQESEGAFDLEAFLNGSRGNTDEPTSTLLDTGEIGRFLENRTEGEVGFRRRFATGTQVTLSNRFLSLRNNSQFLEPNPQTSSTLVVSVVQPLLKGAGYHYNKARLKVAKIDSGVAASEYIQQLENHLLEVNRAYWGVYFARAAYLLRKSLVEQTEEIVTKLEARSDEATASELLRARSELSRRRTGLNRSELAIRNSEERLRSLVNDPEFPIGGDGEFVPVTAPILQPPRESVHAVAMEAVDNRPEIAASFGQLRIAAIRQNAGKHERMPQLDLLAESRMGGLDGGRDVGGAYSDAFDNQASWLLGLQFSQPWENNAAKSRHERLQYELLRQADTVRSTMDTVLLESVVTYRELMTTYRDLQGNLQQVLTTREEIEALRKRLDIDAGNGQTVAYRLQNLLDALERNQLAEEQFLVSVVTYNIAFAALEQAKGTFLKYQDVSIERSESQENKKLEVLRAVPAGESAAPDGGVTAGSK